MPEREVKLALDPSAPPLDLTDLRGGDQAMRIAPARVDQLESTYYDTQDLRLARAGLSLRHRQGEGGPQGTWTLKLADDGTVKGGLSRTEITEGSAVGPVPPRLAGLVRAHVRNESLAPVARLRTSRLAYPVLDLAGAKLGEVADDTVDVLEDGHAVRRFREVEVEITPTADDDLLRVLVKRLRGNGAGRPDPTSKLARALGERADEEPDLPAVSLDAKADMATVVQAAVTGAVRRLVAHDLVVRLDDDVEGVHQARVATRRLRSDLRTLRPVLDPDWVEGLREELKWLADLLGDVRDTDVLGERLRGQLDGLDPVDRSDALPLVDLLAAHRAEAQETLLAALDSQRYLDLLDRLVEGARRPPVAQGHKRAAKVLPRLVARPWRHLARDVKALKDPPDDEALHQVRIRAKRARYAAELAAPVVGHAAAGLADAVSDLQDELGELHDAVVAEAWLRDAARGPLLRHNGVAVGLLVARQRAEAAERRRAWPAAWKQARRPRYTTWLP